MRAERINNKPLTGINRTIFVTLKALSVADMEAKRQGAKTVKVSAEKEEGEIEPKATSGISKKTKVKGVNSTKAGSIKKKDKEIINFTKQQSIT